MEMMLNLKSCQGRLHTRLIHEKKENVGDTPKIVVFTLELIFLVQSILKFTTTEELIERANATTYGLAAGVLTR